MYITSPDPLKKQLEDYEFTFSNGMIFPVTIDREAGDTVDFITYPHAVTIIIASKPHPVDPNKVLRGRELTLFTSHLLLVDKQLREVEELTPEQKEQWRLTIQEMATKTVQ